MPCLRREPESGPARVRQFGGRRPRRPRPGAGGYRSGGSEPASRPHFARGVDEPAAFTIAIAQRLWTFYLPPIRGGTRRCSGSRSRATSDGCRSTGFPAVSVRVRCCSARQRPRRGSAGCRGRRAACTARRRSLPRCRREVRFRSRRGARVSSRRSGP